MGGLEIALLLIGILFFAGSFFFTEKLSSSDLETIEKMSEKEVNVLVDKQLRSASERISASIESRLNDSLNRFDKEANKKTTEEIYSISEHADSVRATLDAAVNTEQKSREEVMFLYNMLSEKQDAVTQLERDAQQMESALRAMKQSVEDAIERLQREQKLTVNVPPAPEEERVAPEEDPEVAALLASMASVMDSANEALARENEALSELSIPAADTAMTSEASNDPAAGQGNGEATAVAEPQATITPETAEELLSFEEEIARELDSELSGLSASGEEETGNINERILALHREGFSDVDIAKQLGKGLGEIKLVLGLFDEE